MKALYRRLGASVLALVLLALAAAGPLNAQDILMPEGPEKGVWIQMSHPEFTDDLRVTATSSVWYLGARYAVTPWLRAVADVPFSYGKWDETGAEQSSALGNPYLGAEFVALPQVMFDFGARVPIGRSDKANCACMIAALNDPMRMEAFGEDWLPISGGVTFAQATPFGFNLRARAGVVGMFYSGSESDVDPEAMVDYGISGTYPVNIARFGFGFSGRWFASEAEGTFSENSLHQMGLTADVLVAGVRPGLALRIPLDRDWREDHRFSIGAYLQVPLR
jgi:hypothetical protein